MAASRWLIANHVPFGVITKKSLATVCEEHTASGAHRIAETPFPDWVSPDVKKAAQKMSEQEALEQLGEPVAELVEPGGVWRKPRGEVRGE